MEIILIQEIAEHLCFKDIRAARKWCNANEVCLIRQGHAEFASKEDFFEMFEHPLEVMLRKKNGGSWESGNGSSNQSSIKIHTTHAPMKKLSTNEFSKKLEDYLRKEKAA